MDLSKVYDCPPHDLIIAKFEAYDFDNISLKLFHRYFSNRKKRVKIGSAISKWIDILTGILHGSILGPLIFNIFINDLIMGMVERWDPLPGPQDPWDPWNPQDPPTHWYTHNSLGPPGRSRTPKTSFNLQDPLGPLELLWTPIISLGPPMFLKVWCVKRISLENNNKFFIFKKL